MSKILIKSNPNFSKDVDSNIYLEVAEMFGDTVQGEGINTGVPATFLRLQHCSLNCGWCDSNEVWRSGNPYTVKEILDIWAENGFVKKFEEGQHLVLTGGSPLKQQLNLIELIRQFIERFGFRPYTEVENEAVLKVHPMFANYIDCWNNSPKLKSSGNTARARYKPDLISQLSKMNNAWFKFVVTEDSDWDEIKRDFLDTDLIRRDQVILMPEGATREELEETRELTVNIAIREGVRFSDRIHIILWNKKTGV